MIRQANPKFLPLPASKPYHCADGGVMSPVSSPPSNPLGCLSCGPPGLLTRFGPTHSSSPSFGQSCDVSSLLERRGHLRFPPSHPFTIFRINRRTISFPFLSIPPHLMKRRFEFFFSSSPAQRTETSSLFTRVSLSW